MNMQTVLLCVSVYLCGLGTAVQAQTIGDDDNEAAEFVTVHSDDQRRNSRLPAPPPDYETRASSVIGDYNQSENAAVRQEIRAEAGGNQRRSASIVPYRADRGRRTVQANTNMSAAVGEPLLAPRARAMPWADGSVCETVSLRYKFKKNKVWVYPPLPNDVGAKEAANQAITACNCAKQVQNLPCYNGSTKIATGNVELIMP